MAVGKIVSVTVLRAMVQHPPLQTGMRWLCHQMHCDLTKLRFSSQRDGYNTDNMFCIGDNIVVDKTC